MFRSILMLLLSTSCLLLPQATAQTSATAPAAAPPTAIASNNPAATAAKQNFDQLQNQWVNLYQELSTKSPKKGFGKKKRNEEIKALNEQIEAMVDKIVAAGLEAHQAGLTNDPTINNTLVSIAGFYVSGDVNGDGGDQYEKALPAIKTLLAAGLGETSPELWLYGGVSAFCLNDFALAEQYFGTARKTGLLGGTPPGQGPGDPINRVWQTAQQQYRSLAATSRAWEKEKLIRDQEARADNLPRVVFQTTRGNIVIELFENEAPIAVANFISLVKAGFYDGIVFHRVLPGFMAQGGDPTGTGMGGPGHNIRCECQQRNARQHFRGSLSMAHAGRDTGGSQFFLTFTVTTSLDGKHTVFGHVIEGMDAASALKRRNPDPRVPGPKPTPDKIIKAQVLRDRGHEYKFEKLPKK